MIPAGDDGRRMIATEDVGQRATASRPEGTRLGGRVVLVTGASRGFGAAVAEACASEGARLVLVARTRGGLEEVDDRVRAQGGEATLVPLDLTDGDMVDRLGAGIIARHGRLDGLVHAAGAIGKLMPTAQFDPSMLEHLIRLMVLGTQRLIRSVDPLLRAGPAGRAVLVADGEAQPGRAYWGGYTAAKAGMTALALAWAAEARLTPLLVNLVEPGPMRTRLREAAYPGAMDVAEPADVAPGVIDLLVEDCRCRGELVRLQSSPA